MDDPEVARAAYWLSWLTTAKMVGGFLVAIGVAIEFTGDWIARPFERKVEAAHELEIARLSADAEAARREIAFANAIAQRANENATALVVASSRASPENFVKRDLPEAPRAAQP
jgi:uncharacterized membrane protein